MATWRFRIAKIVMSDIQDGHHCDNLEIFFNQHLNNMSNQTQTWWGHQGTIRALSSNFGKRPLATKLGKNYRLDV